MASRDCCGDLFKPTLAASPKANQIKSTVTTVLYFHLALVVIKMCLMGVGSGLQDLIGCLILYCGISRIDYCQVMLYIIFNL